jgi:hypothetical protein
VADISQYLAAAGAGIQAARLTGNAGDAWPVGGYAAWIQSVTGTVPAVVDLGGGRVKIVLSSVQQAQLSSWLDTQVSGLLKPKRPGRVEYELGPVLTPWSMKYVVPAAILFLVLGWVGHWYLGGR